MIQYEKIFNDMMQSTSFNWNSDNENRIKTIKKNIDVLAINKLLTNGSTANASLNCYSEEDVLFILKYKEINKLNFLQTALHFKMSRNTLTRWSKHYELKCAENKLDYYLEKKI